MGKDHDWVCDAPALIPALALLQGVRQIEATALRKLKHQSRSDLARRFTENHE